MRIHFSYSEPLIGHMLDILDVLSSDRGELGIKASQLLVPGRGTHETTIYPFDYIQALQWDLNQLVWVDDSLARCILPF